MQPGIHGYSINSDSVMSSFLTFTFSQHYRSTNSGSTSLTILERLNNQTTISGTDRQTDRQGLTNFIDVILVFVVYVRLFETFYVFSTCILFNNSVDASINKKIPEGTTFLFQLIKILQENDWPR